MGIKEQPSFIKGEPNPIFGEIHMVKEGEMPILHNFQHDHFFEWSEGRDVVCKCGKGKTLGEDLTLTDGQIVQI